jgi:signal transduction histidine kinase
LAGLLLLSDWDRHSEEQEQARSSIQMKTGVLASELEGIITEGSHVLKVLSMDRTILKGDRKSADERLGSLTGLFPYSSGITLVGLDGYRISPSPAPTERINMSDRPWFQMALARKTFTVGEFVFSRVTGKPSLPMVFPILDGTQAPVSLLVMPIDLTWVYDQAEGFNLPPDATLNLFDANDLVLVRYPHPQQYIGQVFENSPLIKATHQHRPAFLGTNGLDGVFRLYSLLPFEIDNTFYGTLAVGFPAAPVFEKSDRLLLWSLLTLFLVLVGSFGLSLGGLHRYFLKPLQRLSFAAAQITQGKLSHRIGPARFQDEVGSLMGSFDTMAESLESQQEELFQHRAHLEDLVAQRTVELNESKTELERSNMELQQFAYVASHDLQEPLRMVASFTQLLAEKYSSSFDERGRKFIGFAVDGARRMQQLINDLLIFSRVGAGDLKQQDVETKGCLMKALANLEQLIADRHAEIQVDSLPVVSADPSQLTQVFQNLVGNSLKFNVSDIPRVRISATEGQQEWRFCVEDNGIGIDQEYQERVFIIFQRLNTREEFPGTGIGLALCKRIIERHRGKLWFESAFPQGTRFFFTLPRVSISRRKQ